ncbi:hypothetical protein [Polyangium sp. y55x31]|uniref:hypothetical protein n=1 Tax=Polyangium sp. y55x31 TaxID=3042688 RepID=UPI00248233F8|nr:hypothetical protein [Polyangium sp. y55x31]MDI1483276.1 hypothetical protein [Polyangium sp. y55x31]
MSRSRVRERERIRAAVQTTDPAALAAYAGLLRPVVTNLRTLVEDATAAPSQRVHARAFLRREILRGIRELEARIDAASPVHAPAS